MATMKDVAHLAGVSTATVSRALMNPEKVSTSTRKKVEHAVAEAGYNPNLLNRSLRRSESKAIMILVPDICDPYYTDVLRGIEDTAIEHGYTALICDSAPRNSQDCALQNLNFAKQTDGILLLGSNLPFDINKSEQKNLPPMVMACEYSPELELPTVHIDNLSAAFSAVNHLTHVGHKHIAQIVGDMKSPLTQFRIQGYEQALRRAGLGINPSYTFSGELSFTAGAAAITNLLSLPTPPTAIFCHSDITAIGAIQQAKRLGLRIPQDISIIGFDNIQFAEFCEPALTTISQPRYDIGRQAMLLLLELLKGYDVQSGSRLLDAQLVIRESVEPPSR